MNFVGARGVNNIKYTLSTPPSRFPDLHLGPGELLICLDQLSLPKCIHHVSRQLNSVSLARLRSVSSTSHTAVRAAASRNLTE